mmetsp:Transcript_34452/g.33651  ORF Transcript_34452/g.33651 Transcript_34452/m.33651 type:complete len:120 (-) Transcript_34452:1015-1374(-)
MQCQLKEVVLQLVNAYLMYSTVQRDISYILNGNMCAIETFHSWEKVKHQYKDMNLSEPKNISNSRASFRKSNSSFLSIKDESPESLTRTNLLNKKRSAVALHMQEEMKIEEDEDEQVDY